MIDLPLPVTGVCVCGCKGEKVTMAGTGRPLANPLQNGGGRGGLVERIEMYAWGTTFQ